jgi:hypothetical protein
VTHQPPGDEQLADSVHRWTIENLEDPNFADGRGSPAGRSAVRVALGLFGVVAGLVLWTQPNREVLGWRLALLWALAQLPVVAWNEHGSATLQLLELPLALSSKTTVNGEVTSASEFGVNLVAVVLAGIYAKLQGEAVARQV